MQNLIKVEIEFIKGWLYSKLIEFRYHLTNNRKLIIISDDDPRYKYYAIMHLVDYKNRYYLEKLYVIYPEGDIVSQWIKNQNGIVFMESSKRRIERLKEACRINRETMHVVSRCFPLEKMADDIEYISPEELICYGEYQLFDYEPVGEYEG